jgi:hypothetical protein
MPPDEHGFVAALRRVNPEGLLPRPFILLFPATACLLAGVIVWQCWFTQMQKMLPLVALAFFGLVGVHAAISVGPGGSGVISFTVPPSSTEWSTRFLAGSELSFATTTALDAAVQTNSATTITNTVLDGFGAVPPGQNTLAVWTGGGAAALWTRPAANSATLLMAALQNNTGTDQDAARISYTLGQSSGTPAEQIAAHQVYYSFSGVPGTWVKIPALSGGSAGVRNQVIALNGIWANGAPLYILWVDDNTTGGVDRGYSIDDVSFTGRPPPTLEVIPDFIVDVLHPIFFRALGSNAVPGAQLAYSLDPGAPVAARIHATNGIFVWKPARADADTTNQITIRATDLGAPALSAARTFTVVVRDYVELSLPGVVMQGGQSTNLLLECAVTAPLTNLHVALSLPVDRITAPSVENLVSSIATMSVDNSQLGRVALTFAVLPGQFLAGTQALARLNFTAALEPSSAFVPLQLDEVVAARAQPGLALGVLLNHGRAVVVNREPLVESFAASGSRSLILYGHPGTNYTVETAASAFGPWQTWQPVALSTLFTTLNTTDGTNTPLVFYRAREGTDTPLTLMSSDPIALEKTTTVKKVKKPKKKKLPASRRTKPAITLPQ